MIASTNRVVDIKLAVIKRLTGLYDHNEATAIVNRLLADKYHITLHQLILDPEIAFSESEIVMMHKDMLRLIEGEPVQYITGFTDFDGLRLMVAPGVLIPRPETEELVVWCTRFMKQQKPGTMLDIGSGSGAIALALKKRFPDWSVIANEYSSEAINVLKKNIDSAEETVIINNEDIFNAKELYHQTYDLIVSNPPYIPLSERERMHRNVTGYEPASALFVPDNDPLMFYRAIFQLAKNTLHKTGRVFVEIHEAKEEEIYALAISLGCSYFEIKKDFNEKNRMIFLEF